MLNQTGCIENFRITAGRSDAFRAGYFFADSDAYKWLEAACRIYKVLHGRTVEGMPFVAIPYDCSGNRGESHVNVVLPD